MKILLITASPRLEESKTFILAKSVLKGASESEADTEVIHLADEDVCFCQHCQACHEEILQCVNNDSIPAILNKMIEADGIILASPNYINQVTAVMKALFDRSTHFIHCKRLLGKYVAGVISSGSGQDKEVLDYIRYYAHICGAQYSGGVSACERSVEEKADEAYQLGKKLVDDILEKKSFGDQVEIIEASREHFKNLILLRKDEWPQEYAYWQKNGWL
ncbi:MAG: flavodoxin family protein [Candidatus Omnitrophota bacterium]